MRKKTAHFNFSQKGFTLIELIVVFSVIAIISTVGLAAFVGYSRTQTLNQAAFDLSTTLNTARSKASSQNKPVVAQCNGNNVLNGYSVTLNLVANPNTYSLNVVCSGGTVILLNADGSPQTTKLPPGISFNAGSVTSIFFPIITSSVIGTGDIVLSGYGQTKTIKILTSGVIQ